MKEVPIPQKYLLTISEATAYFGIGEHSLRRLVDDNKDANWLFRVGNRTLIKRQKFEEILDRQDAI